MPFQNPKKTYFHPMPDSTLALAQKAAGIPLTLGQIKAEARMARIEAEAEAETEKKETAT